MEFQPTINSNLIRGHIDTIILHSLKDGDKFPQQICETVFNLSEEKYEINQATLYSSLKRLESLKLVSSYWFDAEDGRRKFYSLTNAGKDNLQDNLSDWSFSKGIIDKLIGVKPLESEVKVVTVEKIVEKPVYIDKNKDSSLSQSVLSPNFSEKQEKQVSSPINLESETLTSKLDSNKNFEIESETKTINVEKEINYKSILNELVVSAKPATILQENKKVVESVDNKPSVETYSDTLERVSVIKNPIKKGSVDLSVLKTKAKNEGYKLRISSEKGGLTSHAFYVNKVKLFSSFTILIIAMLQFLAFALSFKSLFKITPLSIIIPAVFCLIFPIINSVRYAKNPQKITNKPLKKDLVFTALIIVFNLILITFAVDLLANVDLKQTYYLLCGFVFPVTLFIDCFIYFLLKYLFSKRKDFKVKN